MTGGRQQKKEEKTKVYMEEQFKKDKFNADVENPEDIIQAFEEESKLEINKRKNPDYFYSTRRR